MRVQVEIWSDIVCPWCYIGLARFSAALAGCDHAGDVAVLHRSFELDPAAPIEVSSVVDMLMSKYGGSREQVLAMEQKMVSLAAAEGLPYAPDRPTGNSLDAHRLLHLARTVSLEDQVRDALWAAHFGEGHSVFDPAALTSIAVSAGLDAAAVSAVLDGERFLEDVRADEARARELGISGVPFFVVGDVEAGRAYGISGAQSTEVFTRALDRAWTEAAGASA